MSYWGNHRLRRAYQRGHWARWDWHWDRHWERYWRRYDPAGRGAP